jgi:hypothetical protein
LQEFKVMGKEIIVAHDPVAHTAGRNS